MLKMEFSFVHQQDTARLGSQAKGKEDIKLKRKYCQERLQYTVILIHHVNYNLRIISDMLPSSRHFVIVANHVQLLCFIKQYLQPILTH